MRNLMIGLGVLLVGCGGITPMSGDYAMTSTFAAGDCMMQADVEGEEDGELMEVGDSMEYVSSFVFQDDGTVLIDDEDTGCTLDGATVTCEVDTESDLGSDFGMDMILVMSMTSEFTFDSNTSFAGTGSMSMSCVGEDCAAIEESDEVVLPCSADLDYVGSMAEDAASE